MSSRARTKTEEVQARQIEAYRRLGGVQLGPWSSHLFYADPKHLTFSLSRYKFISKMFVNYGSVLEIGCGDAFGSAVVAQAVERYVGIDFDNFIIEDNKTRLKHVPNMSFCLHDIVTGPYDEKFDGAFCLDVIEHIPEINESQFIENILDSLVDGPIIIGTPNISAEAYASEYSKESHINLKSPESLANALNPYFRTVLNFSMNDEVLHTGFSAMAHYIIAIGIGRR